MEEKAIILINLCIEYSLDSKCLLWDVRNSSGPLLTFANSSDTSSDCGLTVTNDVT